MDTVSLPTVPVRKLDTHKGDYGKVLVIAGSETMIGAPSLVALAACRAGAGLVRIAASKDILSHVLTVCPFATGFAFAGAKIKELLAFADEHDCLAVGPGLGQSPTVRRMIIELLEKYPGPMVLDADALNALATLESSEWPKRRDWSNVVLTPHMGEYMRLMSAVMKRGGAAMVQPQETAAAAPVSAKAKVKSLAGNDDLPCTADGVALDIESEESEKTESQTAAPTASAPDRTPLAELLAKGTGAVVVLKGHQTIITDGHRVAVNKTGNPAMATGGSGDALTGILAALIAASQGKGKIDNGVLEAAVLAVHVHGLAGDMARDELIGEGVLGGGLVTTDLIHRIPKALATRIR